MPKSEVRFHLMRVVPAICGLGTNQTVTLSMLCTEERANKDSYSQPT
eukprot:COSAG05_NODE_17638_length_322_cov_0.663677_1_plen_46_part_10